MITRTLTTTFAATIALVRSGVMMLNACAGDTATSWEEFEGASAHAAATPTSVWQTSSQAMHSDIRTVHPLAYSTVGEQAHYRTSMHEVLVVNSNASPARSAYGSRYGP
jgi:hypothetical protein